MVIVRGYALRLALEDVKEVALAHAVVIVTQVANRVAEERANLGAPQLANKAAPVLVRTLAKQDAKEDVALLATIVVKMVVRQLAQEDVEAAAWARVLVRVDQVVQAHAWKVYGKKNAEI